MKICVTSLGDNLESAVDPKFGRAAFFIFIDPKTLEYEVLSNTYAQSGGGAGIQSGQLMSKMKVTAVITGHVGPNAFQTLTAGDIDIITGISGTVGNAILRFQKGELYPVKTPTVESHFGMTE